MLKRVIVLGILFCVGISAFGSVFAIDVANSEIADMAKYFPEDTSFLITIRTDEAYLDELDSLIARIIDKFPPELGDIPPVSLRDELSEELADSDAEITLDDIFAWVGNYATIGLLGIPEDGFADELEFEDDGPSIVALQITDRTLTEQFFDRAAEEEDDGDITVTPANGFTMYKNSDDPSTTVLIGDTAVIFLIGVSAEDYFSMSDGDSLLDNSAYQQIMGDLPAPSYDILGYVDLPQFMAAIMSDSDFDDLAALGISDQMVGALAVGLTVLDGVTFTIDVSQAAVGGISSDAIQAFDPSFARFIPNDATYLIQTTNLTSTIEGLFDLIARITSETGEEDPTSQIETALRFTGLDLQEDVLSWTTGNYAIFLTLDLPELVRLGIEETLDTDQLPFDFGVILEATDPELAQNTASTLANFLALANGEEEGFSITNEEIAGVDVSVISLTIPSGFQDMTELAFALGASDEIFFFTTLDTAQKILTGDGVLANDPRYIEASEYFLPERNVLLYTNNVGVVTMFGLFGGGVNLMPFDNPMGQRLNNATPPRTTIQNNPDEIDPIELLNAMLELFHSSSITSQVTENGSAVTRAVITIED